MDWTEFELVDLSERDWNEIENKGREIVAKGAFHKDPVRCLILAWLVWCAENQRAPMIDEEDLSQYVEH